MVVSKPRILVASRYFPPAFQGGGPIRSISALVSSAEVHFDFFVACSAKDLGEKTTLEGVSLGEWVEWSSSSVRYHKSGAPSFREWLEIIREVQPDVIYVNSLFDVRYLMPIFASYVMRSGASVLLAPRGELLPGAMRKSNLKKRAFTTLLRRSNFMRNVNWHASNEDEAASIRAVFGERCEVFVAENLWVRSGPVVRHESGSRLVIAFLSRIAPKKNLLGAVRALSALTEEVTFLVAGPVDEASYWKLVTESIDELPANVTVQILGALNPEDSRALLTSSDLFLFPTFGENFGHVIVEALDVGTPVIVGPDTPFSRWANECRAIEVCDPDDVSSITEGIRSLMERVKCDSQALSKAAEDLLESQFSQKMPLRRNIQMFRACASND